MTTKKLFYTCPIEAAYMSKNFGVKLMTPDGRLLFLSNDVLRNLWYWGADYGSRALIPEDNQYVHPDSLHIFKPKGGDVIFTDGRNINLKEGELAFDKNYGEIFNEYPVEDNTHDIKYEQNSPNDTWFVVNRGRPFFMPQIENK